MLKGVTPIDYKKGAEFKETKWLEKSCLIDMSEVCHFTEMYDILM